MFIAVILRYPSGWFTSGRKSVVDIAIGLNRSFRMTVSLRGRAHNMETPLTPPATRNNGGEWIYLLYLPHELVNIRYLPG